MNPLQGCLAGLMLVFSAVSHAETSHHEPSADSLGVVAQTSRYSVSETADRFEAILAKKGLTQFARIDHSENAKTVDLVLRPTTLIIFGNPKVGTPLMQCQQTIALDLPQKVLVWQDEQGQVKIGYNDPNYLKSRHHVSGCEPVFHKISQVLSKLVSAAIQK